MFVIISDTDDTFNFIVASMYTQLFNLLCDKADDEHNGRLPYHVRLLLDEFANIGQIPKFDKLIATIRMMEEAPPGVPMLMVLTNDKGLNGAAAMFYPGQLDQVADGFHSDFFVLPSSVHEVLILPDDKATD